MREARIGEVLCRMGVIARQNIPAILAHQRQTRQKFGQIAIRLGLATHEQVWEAWARQLAQREGIDLAETGSDTAALELIPLSTARQIGIVPLRLWGRHLVIAAPPDLPKDTLAKLANTTHCRIHVCIADCAAIRRQLRELAARDDRFQAALLAS